MALATRCPHCDTTFRVAHDQLKLRAGLVRCGACKEIFNGIEHLLRPTEPVTPTEPAASPAAALSNSSRVHSVADHAVTSAKSDANTGGDYPAFGLRKPSAEMSEAPASQGDVSYRDPHAVDPLQRMTLMQFSNGDALPDDVPDQHAVPATASAAAADDALPNDNDAVAQDPIAERIDAIRRRPWRSKKKSLPASDEPIDFDSDHDEPGFLALAERAPLSQPQRRSLIAATVVLGLLVLGQAVFLGRDQIAARLPASKPFLEQACSLAGCQVTLLADADAVSIESSELVTLDAARNSLGLNLLLRNRSALPQRWPLLELTLLDASDRPVVRRVFGEKSYLPAQTDVTKGFGPNSEQSAKISFDLLQQKAANYRVYLFYP